MGHQRGKKGADHLAAEEETLAHGEKPPLPFPRQANQTLHPGASQMSGQVLSKVLALRDVILGLFLWLQQDENPQREGKRDNASLSQCLWIEKVRLIVGEI